MREERDMGPGQALPNERFFLNVRKKAFQ